MKKLTFLLLTATTLAACSNVQKPAPYEANTTRYYGKNSSYSQNNYVNSNNDSNEVSANNPDEYNRYIDQQNAKVAKPITGSNSQAVSSNGITRKPLGPVAIDGDQQAIKLGSRQQPLHYGESTQVSNQRNNEAETVPPVEEKETSMNVSKTEGKVAEDKLAHIKPLVKPQLTTAQRKEIDQEEKHEAKAAAKPAKTTEVAEVDDNSTEEAAPAVAPAPAPVAAKPAPVAKKITPTITPKIQKIETSAGNPPKSTVAMINKTDAAESDDIKPVSTEKPQTLSMPPREAVADEKKADAEPEEAPAPAKEVTTTAEQKAQDAAPEKPISDIKPVAAATNKSAPQFIKPVDGVVVSEFGNDKSGSFNDGINIQAPEGTPVKAAGGGTVVYSGDQLQGYGNLIIIRHANGYLTAYSHLKELELKKGDKVAQGSVVGHVGKTGNVDTPQLHFGIRKGREPVDPKDYL